MSSSILEIALDAMTDAVYIVDSAGNYIYTNSAYARLTHKSKDELLSMNVSWFLESQQINYSVCEIVYKEKRQVVRFQDVNELIDGKYNFYRQLIVATPIFDEVGHVCNIVAVLRPLAMLNDEYNHAKLYEEDTIGLNIRDKEDRSSIVAESQAMQEVFMTANEISDTDANVLICGESGTGKEVVAQYIHKHSNRCNKPFVTINCASVPESLLEAELFGYEKGSFTGASSKGKPGLFEEADGGTLFLDEINSMPLSMQGKLLRAVESKSIQRVGATKPRYVDFRLLAATNVDLREQVQAKNFRADLYYRINVVPITLPPLRERREDIIPLAMLFLESYCRKNGRKKDFSKQMLKNMYGYDWPGNVRELKNFVERAVLLSSEEHMGITNIGDISGFPEQKAFMQAEHSTGHQLFQGENFYEEFFSGGATLADYIDMCENNLLQWAKEKYGSTYKMAEALGTSQAAIMRRKKKYDKAES